VGGGNFLKPERAITMTVKKLQGWSKRHREKVNNPRDTIDPRRHRGQQIAEMATEQNGTSTMGGAGGWPEGIKMNQAEG